ncbi:response regulator transcription factor [Falsirhodobacter algicola]|uniref:DNA-binding response regulator n=1 Tax=Falsirhodobacter algicola TaxID=2692330 RepID=A0A8J8MRD1_9RHOB|nr:response regulator transcription factor [Falsirhodobacter algicola]QUS35109.1 DNA-binding response regulator [Falsirhodobacter algicola]
MRAVAEIGDTSLGLFPFAASGPIDPSWMAKPLPSVAVIDARPLERECFVRCLEAYRAGAAVVGHATIDGWIESRTETEEVVLYNLGTRSMLNEDTAAEMAAIVEAARPHPVIVLSDSREVATMLAVLTSGAAGFISPDGQFTDVVEAIRVAQSGGIFMPRNSLVSLSEALTTSADRAPDQEDHFTDRQLAVARALQRGAANKTIAYELNLCESTVKVHIRNIMRKVKATNRTQAALRLNALIGHADAAPRR